MVGLLLTPNNIETLQEHINGASLITRFISGGTDMILKLREDGFEDIELIDLSCVNELKYIKEEDGFVKIGAGMTLSDIISSPLIKKYVPFLASAADQVGSTQIRNAATIGGNVANAFAGADTIPPLMALDAILLLLGKNGATRQVPIKEFLVGNRKNTLETGEIITEIKFLKGQNIQYFGKIGSRSRVTISKLNMAVHGTLQDGKIEAIQVVFGALGKTAIKSESIEKYLLGKNTESLSYDAMKEVFVQQVDEAIPGRASRVYKRDAVLSLAFDLYNVLKDGGIR